jgi:hypothetical protein
MARLTTNHISYTPVETLTYKANLLEDLIIPATLG